MERKEDFQRLIKALLPNIQINVSGNVLKNYLLIDDCDNNKEINEF